MSPFCIAEFDSCLDDWLLLLLLQVSLLSHVLVGHLTHTNLITRVLLLHYYLVTALLLLPWTHARIAASPQLKSSMLIVFRLSAPLTAIAGVVSGTPAELFRLQQAGQILLAGRFPLMLMWAWSTFLLQASMGMQRWVLGRTCLLDRGACMKVDAWWLPGLCRTSFTACMSWQQLVLSSNDPWPTNCMLAGCCAAL